jgi:hypothetical protein
MNASGGGETSTYAFDQMPHKSSLDYPVVVEGPNKLFLGAQTDPGEIDAFASGGLISMAPNIATELEDLATNHNHGTATKLDHGLDDTGSRQTFSTGMVRDTSADKTRYDLLWPKDCPEGSLMLDRWAELLTRGMKHYAERNWELAETEEELDRFKESAARHFFKWMNNIHDGDDNAAAVFFNIQGYEFVKGKLRD